MKKLAILLSLFVLMTALCIPAFAAARDPLPTITAVKGTPDTVEWGDAASAQIDQPYYGPNTMLHANVYAMYDDTTDRLYFRFHANAAFDSITIFLNTDSGILACANKYDSATDTWTEDTSSIWGGSGYFDTISIAYRDTGDSTCLVDVACESPVELAEGESLSIAFTMGGSGSAYAWTFNDINNDMYGGRPGGSCFGTMTLGAAGEPIPEGGGEGGEDVGGGEDNGPTADALSVAVLASAVALVGAGIVVSKKKHNA